MVTRILFLIFVNFVIFSECENHSQNAVKRAVIINEAKELISSATSKIDGNSFSKVGKTIGSSVTDYYVSRAKSGLSIAILNRMRDRYLMNPMLYLVKGKTVGPPQLLIPPAAKDQSDAQITFFEENPKGVLCYDCFTSSNSLLKFLCIYFVASGQDERKYMVATLNRDLNIFQEKNIVEQFQKLTDAWKSGENVVVKRPDLEVITITQMTTGDNARIFLEITDSDFSAQSSTDLKRGLIAFGVSLAGGIASSLSTAAMKYISTEYGTILTVENLNSESIFTIFDPIWYQDKEVQVLDIIPWHLKPMTSTDITLTTKRKFFGAVVFILSYQIDETLQNSPRIVLAVWWSPIYKLKNTARYSISWLYSKKRSDVPIALAKLAQAIKREPDNPVKVNNLLKDDQNFEAIGENSLKAYYININKFQCYKFWKFPISRQQTKFKDLKLLTAMGNGKKNGMIIKIFGSAWKPGPTDTDQNSASIVDPVDYNNSKEQFPAI